MDEIVKLVMQQVGLPADKAQLAVTVVLNHLKTKIPALAGPLSSLTAGGDAGGAPGLADVAGKLGGLGDMFKK